MLKKNPYLTHLLVWVIEFVVFLGIGLIFKDPIHKLPQAIDLGIVVLPAQWAALIIIALLAVVLISAADRALRRWLINEGWLEGNESARNNK